METMDDDGTARRAPDVRSRLHGSALKLFREHGISGTTLQMIADDLGVTKAAVYYHYRTKDEIVLGVVSPLMEGLRRVVELAEAQRGHRARVEVALTGLADLTVRAREVYAVLTGDPSIPHVGRLSPEFAEVGRRVVDVLSGPDPSPQTRVRVTLLLSGLVGPLKDPECARIDDDALRTLLVDAGRRLLHQRS